MSRFTISHHAQGSPEWFKERMGLVTGSEVSALYAKAKSDRGDSKTRAGYMRRLVLERLGVPSKDNLYRSPSMAWGNATEPRARLAFEARTGYVVREAGFCKLNRLAAGCSVDAFIHGDEISARRLGVLELKCPDSKTHLLYLEDRTVPTIYVPQITHELWVTGAQFAKFVSFDPRFPPDMRLLIVHVERDDAAIREHETLVRQFLMETDAHEKQMRLCAA